MSIKLEEFSVLKSPKQGWDISRLVAQEKGWLSKVFPQTVERYRDLPHAVKNVARLATTEGMRAYVVRKERQAVGLATIIFDQEVIHPSAGIVRGDDLDYWLSARLDHNTHSTTAVALLTKRSEISLAQDASRRNTPAIFTTVSGQTNHALGFRSFMEPVGEPAVLATVAGEDPFGVTKGGAVLQLYRR